MNTPAHMALSLATLGHHRRPGDWWLLSAGAILPDLFLFAAYGLPGRDGDTMALLIDVFNSVPVYLAGLAASLVLGARGPALLAGSALLHVGFDLPLHAGDAHVHFWPLTDAVFVSPVSFWDAAHFGRIAGTLEGLLFVACLVVIWRRLDGAVQRMACAGFALFYGAAFVHFVGHAFAGEHWALW